MVVQLLPPGMKNLDDAGCCHEILLVSGKLKKCLGGASVKKRKQKLLIAVEQPIQFMRQCENHMIVRGVDHFGTALIHPDFFEDGLAARTIAVAAGVVVDLCVPAVKTDAPITAESAGFTVQDGVCRFNLVQVRMCLFKVSVPPMPENLLDLKLRHDVPLPICPEG